MTGRFEGWIHRFLQVPPRPEMPVGGEGTLQIFRAARGYFHYRLVSWVLKQISVFIGIAFGFIMFNELEGVVRRAFVGMEVLALVFAVLYLPISFLLVSLDFNYRWYMVTDRSLRMREGILKVQERTMTFSNVQNVAIRQGPLQRFFGIADVEVRTAGGGGGGDHGQQDDSLAENMHIGYFRGVDNAEDIRDLIMNHLRRLSASGLGDPEEATAESPEPAEVLAVSDGSGVVAPASPGHAMLSAAEGLLAEMRALRLDVEKPMADG